MSLLACLTVLRSSSEIKYVAAHEKVYLGGQGLADWVRVWMLGSDFLGLNSEIALAPCVSLSLVPHL